MRATDASVQPILMEIPVGARERQLRISAPSHLKFIHSQLFAPFIVRLVDAQSVNETAGRPLASKVEIVTVTGREASRSNSRVPAFEQGSTPSNP